MKLTQLQRIQKAHISLMRNKDWVHIAGVTLMGKVTVDDSFPTAYTDGVNVTYGEKFLASLTDDAEVRGIVVHENTHKACLHLLLYRGFFDTYGAEVTNAALDFVINRSIKKAEPYLKLPKGGCYDPKYDDEAVWDVHAVIKDLLKNGKKGGGKGQGQQGAANGGFDTHDWEAAKKLSKEEQEKLTQEIKSALRQGMLVSKQMGGSGDRSFDELLNPQVPWQEHISMWMQQRMRGVDKSTFARPNRRHLHAGMYLPSRYTEAVRKMAMFIDTSGSISNDVLREVMTEVHSGIKELGIDTLDILYWDTSVCRHEHYEAADADLILQSTKPAGGGGTSPSCVPEYCRTHGIDPSAAIWFSDGEVGGDWGEGITCPSLWIITKNGRAPTHLPHVKLT